MVLGVISGIVKLCNQQTKTNLNQHKQLHYLDVIFMWYK